MSYLFLPFIFYDFPILLLFSFTRLRSSSFSSLLIQGILIILFQHNIPNTLFVPLVNIQWHISVPFDSYCAVWDVFIISVNLIFARLILFSIYSDYFSSDVILFPQHLNVSTWFNVMPSNSICVYVCVFQWPSVTFSFVKSHLIFAQILFHYFYASLQIFFAFF